MARPLQAAVLALALVGATACAAATRAPLAPARLFDADSARVQVVAPGVTHTIVHDGRGPWTLHVVEVDTRVCRPALQARKPGRTVSARATTSELGRDALLAANADFFALPGGTPVGAHVSEGVPLIGPTDRPVFALTHAGWRIGLARMRGSVVAGSDSAWLAQINRLATPFSAYAGTREGVTLFTAWMGDSVPADSNALRITLRLVSDPREAAPEIRGRAVVLAVDSPAPVTRLRAGEAVLHVHGGTHGWARRRAPGDTVRWQAAVHVQGADAVEAFGGFPELLREQRAVLHEQTVNAAFSTQRHPRTAIGWTADRRLLLVAVDGRQPPYSDGMTLAELTWLFQRLGATHALNLDGGGSTALVIHGRLVNRPSDAQGERAVGNAVALAGCTR